MLKSNFDFSVREITTLNCCTWQFQIKLEISSSSQVEQRKLKFKQGHPNKNIGIVEFQVKLKISSSRFIHKLSLKLALSAFYLPKW